MDRRLEEIRQLVAGGQADVSKLAYEFDDWHIGVVARGVGRGSALRDLARAADRHLFVARPDREIIWAWLGGRRRTAISDGTLRKALDAHPEALIALGEPARGLQGWRLTHEQAIAAFRIFSHSADGLVQYADVAVLASIARDPVFARSLRQLYLAPLGGGHDGGAALRDTLRAYFTAGRNVSSAASALGVSRQTVGNRLRRIEEKLGRTLGSCTLEIEIALLMDEAGAHLSGS